MGISCAKVGLAETSMTGLTVVGNKFAIGAEVVATTGASVGAEVGAMGEILITT